jgi:hypothetical protein
MCAAESFARPTAPRPRGKGTVEHDVPYVHERLLRGHSFTSYEQANIEWLAGQEDLGRSWAGDEATHAPT